MAASYLDELIVRRQNQPENAPNHVVKCRNVARSMATNKIALIQPKVETERLRKHSHFTLLSVYSMEWTLHGTETGIRLRVSAVL